MKEIIDDEEATFWKSFADDAKLRRKDIEPARFEYAKRQLWALECSIYDGPDDKSIHVLARDGRTWNFWPYKGYWAGKKQGRGIKALQCEIEKGKTK